jgi:hypothetical protein
MGSYQWRLNMINFKILLMLGMYFISINAEAGIKDVYPQKFNLGDLYVRVTKNDDNTVQFERCRNGLERSTCTLLGRKAPYTIEELEDARNSKNWNIALTTLLDVAIVAAVPYVGLYIGLGLGIGSTSVLYGIMGATGIGATALVSAMDLHPVAQYQQARTVRDEIIHDKDVVVKDMQKFISRFEKVLKTIR